MSRYCHCCRDCKELLCAECFAVRHRVRDEAEKAMSYKEKYENQNGG